MRWIAILLVLGISSIAATAQGVQQPGEYDARFFQVLKTLFDDFSTSDLQRTFQSAPAVKCSELVGEWRPAAFFNDDRNLERWFHKTFGDVQAELARYRFQGRCETESAKVDVTTRFPVRESVDAYNSRKIEFARIAYQVNAPVPASFDSKAKTYSFDLPYLYLLGRRNGADQYSLVPPQGSSKPTPDVTNQWNCKAVKPVSATYRFLLCRTMILPRNASVRSQVEAVAGTSAYVVLSDGKEAVATFTMSVGDGPAPTTSSNTLSKLVELGVRKFRLQFTRRSWEDKIDSVMTLAGGKLEFPEAARTSNVDYCEWIPQSPATANIVNDTDKSVQYLMTIKDREAASPTTISIEARTAANARLGTLRCFFPNAPQAVAVDMTQFTAVAGDHINVELR
jgi:hypothetical protein